MERDLRQINDDEIVELFLAREERAIVATEKKYERYLYVTAKNILGDEEDSKECANDALYLLWMSIPPDRPKNFKAYISRFVRNIAINRVTEMNRQKRVPPELVSSLDDLVNDLVDPSNVEKEFDENLLKDCLNRFIASLNKRRRYIFVCKYFCFDSVPRIAGLLDVSERTVYLELAEIKRRLKSILKKEGFIS